MRKRQRFGVKPLGQRNPPIMDSSNREVRTTIVSICDWGARLDGMVNTSEQPLNTVTTNRLKMLASLSQKAT